MKISAKVDRLEKMVNQSRICCTVIYIPSCIHHGTSKQRE